MNINYGDDNFYTRYLKRFLNAEMPQNAKVLGEFDKTDKQMLVNYLNLPNVENMFKVDKQIITEFPKLDILFNRKLNNDSIEFTSKNIDVETAKWIIDNVDAIKVYCASVGWYIKYINEWIDVNKDINDDGIIDINDRNILNNIVYNSITYSDSIMRKADLNYDGVIDMEDLDIFNTYFVEGKLKITISKLNRRNYFPNKDMHVFINLFEGDFLYNYALRDNSEGAYDDLPHPNDSKLLKIAVLKCKPGQKLTIAHNNASSQHLVIGCSSAILKSDITRLIAKNVVEIDLNKGTGYQYTCSSIENGDSIDANYVLIQCASNYSDISTTKTVSVTLDTGDINFDGKIDLQDYTMLANYTATGEGADKLHWTATPKQLAVMDINKDGKIDNADAVELKNFIDGKSEKPSLGTSVYTYKVDGTDNTNNVSNFLIIDGHYDSKVNIPFDDFIYYPWVIHEKFFNYLLDMSITPYSDSDDISYLQELLKEYYPQYSLQKDYFYPGRYDDNMKTLIKRYQLSKSDYTLGDLNRDNKLDKVDLELLRKYLDKMEADINSDNNVNSADEELLRKYLQTGKGLSDSEKKKADAFIEKYGRADALDKMKYFIEDTESDLSATQKIRADVNQDGYIDENDYNFLKDQIENDGDDLKQYNVSFMLGYCDVQTESLLEEDFNYRGLISEISK